MDDRIIHGERVAASKVAGRERRKQDRALHHSRDLFSSECLLGEEDVELGFEASERVSRALVLCQRPGERVVLRDLFRSRHDYG